MANKLDKQLAPILRNLQTSRALLPAKPAADELYFGWIKSGLSEMESILRSIDTEKVLVVRRARQPTHTVFEDNLEKVVKRIDDSHGILYSVNGIFKNKANHSAEDLDKVRRIRDNTMAARRQIKLLPHPFRRLLIFWKPVIILIILCVLAIVGGGVKQASEAGTPSVRAVKEQLKADAKEITRVAKRTGAGPIDVLKNVAERLKETEQALSAILIALTALVTVVKGFRGVFQGSDDKGRTTESVEKAAASG